PGTYPAIIRRGSSARIPAVLFLLMALGVSLDVTASAALLEPLRAVYLHPAPFNDAEMSAEQRASRIAAVLEDARDCGLSTVFPYANTSGGRAYYPSQYLRPAGTEDGDTLGLIAREAQARGLGVIPAMC